MRPGQPAEIECPSCAGDGCDQCDGGYFRVETCPTNYIGSELVADIEAIAACGENYLPVAGGIMDQSAWFIELRRTLKREEQLIEQEREQRRKHGRR